MLEHELAGVEVGGRRGGGASARACACPTVSLAERHLYLKVPLCRRGPI